MYSDSETTSPAWRVLALTSQWFAHGKHLVTWSSATWQNMELFSRLPSAFTPTATIVPRVFQLLAEQLKILSLCACSREEAALDYLEVWPGKKEIQLSLLSHALYLPLPSHRFSIVFMTSGVSSSGPELALSTETKKRKWSSYFVNMKEGFIFVIVVSWLCFNALLSSPSTSSSQGCWINRHRCLCCVLGQIIFFEKVYNYLNSSVKQIIHLFCQ